MSVKYSDNAITLLRSSIGRAKEHERGGWTHEGAPWLWIMRARDNKNEIVTHSRDYANEPILH